MDSIRFGILTVSDRCSKEEQIDKSGPTLVNLVTSDSKLNATVTCTAIIPDEENSIKETLIAWSNTNIVDVILTTGGTGFAKRDITPEATKKVIEREAPALSYAMFQTSYKITPMAVLSRAVCGIRDNTLIINLPGSPKAAKECFSAISPAIPHAVDLLKNVTKKVTKTHEKMENSSCQHFCQQKQYDVTVGLESVVQRHRESPFPMLSVDEAKEIMLKSVQTLDTEVLFIGESLGKILREDVYASCDIPPFRASIKDGYAVITTDGKGLRQVLGGVKAGSEGSPFRLQSGTCVRVNTGSPIPNGATAVVQVEDTKLITSEGDEEKMIEILLNPKTGQDIREIGSDLEKGTKVLNAGVRIGSAEIGLFASCGCNSVTVSKMPLVGVLSTGDELQEVTKGSLLPGRIYDSNKITLLSLLKENGFDAIDLGIAKDEEKIVFDSLTNAMEQVDVIVTTGSLSMGDRDLLKPIMQKYFNATIHFGRLNMKPGKPTTFATCTFLGKRKYLLCLPGNPVSAAVTAHLFLIPLLNRMQGIYLKPTIVQAKLTSSYNLDPRPEYARVTLEWNSESSVPIAKSTGNQISSKLSSFRDANAFLMLPGRTTEKSSLKEGDVVPAMLLQPLFYAAQIVS